MRSIEFKSNWCAVQPDISMLMLKSIFYKHLKYKLEHCTAEALIDSYFLASNRQMTLF